MTRKAAGLGLMVLTTLLLAASAFAINALPVERKSSGTLEMRVRPGFFSDTYSVEAVNKTSERVDLVEGMFLCGYGCPLKRFVHTPLEPGQALKGTIAVSAARRPPLGLFKETIWYEDPEGGTCSTSVWAFSAFNRVIGLK